MSGINNIQLYAVMLKVPMSGSPELDSMIRESRRLDMATAAMQGMLSVPEFHTALSDEKLKPVTAMLGALHFADALLAASEKESGKCFE